MPFEVKKAKKTQVKKTTIQEPNRRPITAKPEKVNIPKGEKRKTEKSIITLKKEIELIKPVDQRQESGAGGGANAILIADMLNRLDDLEATQGYRQTLEPADWENNNGLWEFLSADSNYYHNQSGANGNYLEYSLSIWEGNYNYAFVVNQTRFSGILKVYIDGVLKITKDLYALIKVPDKEYRGTISIVPPITTKNRIKIKLIIDGKNTASLGYDIEFRYFSIWRSI